MEFFSILTNKPTVFSIIGIVSIVLGIPLCIKTYHAEGPKAIMGFLVFGFVSLATVCFIIDRILIQYISQSSLLISQAFLLLSAFLVIKYKRKKLIIYVRSEKIKYFVLIENSGVFSNTKLSYSFPFNKRMKIRSTIHPYSPELVDLNKIKIKPESLWGSYSVRTKKIQGKNITVFIRMGLNEYSKVQKALKKDLEFFFEQEHAKVKSG